MQHSEWSMMMSSFLLVSAILVLASIAIGLVRILYSRQAADCMMAAQLVGTGGIAVLLLVAVATETAPTGDVALMLALLAAFASVAFVGGMRGTGSKAAEGADK